MTPARRRSPGAAAVPTAVTVVTWALVLGLAGVALVGCSRGDGPGRGEVVAQRERQVRAAAAEAGLSPAVQDVLGRAARAPAATFTATYASGADRVVVAQRPPRRRVDVLGAGGAPVESLVTGADGTAVRCVRGVGGGPSGRWRCDAGAKADAAASAGFGAFSPELVARTVEALTAAAGTYRIDAYDLAVAKVPAQCLRSTRRDPAVGAPAAQLCVTPSGVPLLLDRGDGTPVLRAVAYRATASAADVRRPDAKR